jgi:2-methylcitrate dehydratase PrpD
MTLTNQLARYVASAIDRPLPEAAQEATKHHVLDTIASIVAGNALAAGRAGHEFVRQHAPSGEAVVIARETTTPPPYAALANAMAAHADESDDTHELSKSHPGCSIVPCALATVQTTDRTGAEFLRAVALGYDIGPRVNMAGWPSFADVRKERRGTPGISGTFGSASAAAALRGFDANQVQTLFSYVAQQIGGMNTWKRDTEHIEKAFVLAGWPAFCALFSVSVVEFGWSGVPDVFEGDPNFLEVVGKNPEPERLVEELGERFEVERTHIKVHAVGSPAQAPIQALLHVLRENRLANANIASVKVTLPAVLAHTVQPTREMPDINLQYLLSTVVADGVFSYAAAHDLARFAAWRKSGGDSRITVVADESMEPRRQASVEVATTDAALFSHRVLTVRGAPENPMTMAEVREKAQGLMGPVIGDSRARQIADAVQGLDDAPNVGHLIDILKSAPA